MIKIKVYKDKQYLVFEFDNRKVVKYDFAKKRAIGLNGKPVNGLQRQLKDFSIDEIIQSCEDKNYAEFLQYLVNEYGAFISNPGTFLSKIIENSKYEQLFSAGLKANQLSNNIHYNINEIPKSLIKIAKEKSLYISNILIKYWSEDIDAHCLAYSLDYVSLNDEDLRVIFTYGRNIGNYANRTYRSVFNYLVSEFNYTPKAFLLYLDYLKTYEALEHMEYILSELYDYAKMMREISNRFDKFPKNFLTTHRIAARNYNRLKEKIDENKFKEKINKYYEYKTGDYIFLYPNCTQDIKDEAVQQNNCVASYIKDVIEGRCHILFLRKKGQKEKSLVTIEVDPVLNKIVQAKGRFNRDTTEEENNAIAAWNKKFSIKRKEIAA